MRLLALLGLVLALAATFVVAGCGGDEEVSPTPTDVTGTVPTETETETETETATETETDTETTEPAGEGNAEAGKQVFLGPGGCGSCHTLADAGTSGTVGPNLDEAQPSFELAVQTITNGRGAMPAFKGQLSEQQIVDVATYVSQAAGG